MAGLLHAPVRPTGDYDCPCCIARFGALLPGARRTAGKHGNGATQMTERQLQDAVVRLARMSGWLVYHTHDSRGSAPGFPDLCLAREGRLVFAELKSARGRVTPAQRLWLDTLRAGPAEAYLWHPMDWLDGTVERLLKRSVT